MLRFCRRGSPYDTSLCLRTFNYLERVQVTVHRSGPSERENEQNCPSGACIEDNLHKEKENREDDTDRPDSEDAAHDDESQRFLFLLNLYVRTALRRRVGDEGAAERHH